jgi:hypothetical protein
LFELCATHNFRANAVSASDFVAPLDLVDVDGVPARVLLFPIEFSFRSASVGNEEQKRRASAFRIRRDVELIV